MNGRSPIRERSARDVFVELENVLNRMRGAGRAPVREHVGPDLGERGFEQHEPAIVVRMTRGLAEALDGLVQRFQSIVQLVQGGMELKVRLRGHNQKPERASSTVA